MSATAGFPESAASKILGPSLARWNRGGEHQPGPMGKTPSPAGSSLAPNPPGTQWTSSISLRHLTQPALAKSLRRKPGCPTASGAEEGTPSLKLERGAPSPPVGPTARPPPCSPPWKAEEDLRLLSVHAPASCGTHPRPPPGHRPHLVRLLHARVRPLDAYCEQICLLSPRLCAGSPPTARASASSLPWRQPRLPATADWAGSGSRRAPIGQSGYAVTPARLKAGGV